MLAADSSIYIRDKSLLIRYKPMTQKTYIYKRKSPNISAGASS
ncbi:protein of unknown function [Shewanella benthica]|uniref:Uncharacterized protein n=1 Tax=Shewanella benthica TaxID=43661 RepID=A0A330M3I5_9GAMM|nr:protein of unknown function [Shewanella benthica]